MTSVKDNKTQRRKRSWRTIKDPQASCLLCGESKPLAGAHIVPRKILDLLPEVDRKAWYDEGGINVLRLCFNHHTLFDDGRLDYEHHLIMMGHALRVVAELNRYVSKISMGRITLTTEFYDEFDLYISKLPVYDKSKED